MQIKAAVNPRLLAKANRFFTGDVDNRIIELLQNARRAGASQVVVEQNGEKLAVTDNGSGITDWNKLLDLGGSGWGHDIEQGEDPAGVGLFSLAPRKLVVRSNGKKCTVTKAAWGGTPVSVVADPEPIQGTRLEFDDEWTYEKLNPQACYSGIQVLWKKGDYDEKWCERKKFLPDDGVHYPELGCRISAVYAGRLKDLWLNNYDNVIVNFHGQTVKGRVHGIDEAKLAFLVEMTGEPTPIKMVLPAREKLVQNDAINLLNEKCVLEGFKYMARVGHNLPYNIYLQGKKLVPDLPESRPVFEVGGLDDDESRGHSDSRVIPISGALDRAKVDPKMCYCINENDSEQCFNAHVLALALEHEDDRFVPIRVSYKYSGYQWAKELPSLEELKAVVTPSLHKAYVGPSNAVHACENIRLIAKTSDGKTFESDVRMAYACAIEDGAESRYEEFHAIPDVFLNHDSGESSFMQMMVAPYEDGEHTDEQIDEEFWEDFQKFALMLHGKDEAARHMLFVAVKEVPVSDWASLTLHENDESLTIVFKDGTTRKVLLNETIEA